MTTPQQKPEYMTDAQGRMVPLKSVRAVDILENDFVLDLFTKARQLNTQLIAFKEQAFSETDTFVSLLAEQYGLKKGGSKGNVTFTSYDGLTMVKVSNADFIQFGPQLQVAKELIGEFIKSEAEGGISDSLKTLVFNAFRVDKEGRVNKAEILGLRKYDITHEKWQAAMQAITDSIRISSTKRYVRFYRRETLEQDFKAVNLDLAKV